METRTCKTCGAEHLLTDFPLAGKIKGVTYYRHLCVPCYSKTKIPRKQKMRAEYYEWKKTLVCSRCGFDDYRALQFHHNGDKEQNVADMVRKSMCLESIKEEAKKCEVLCANCHQIEHHHGV